MRGRPPKPSAAKRATGTLRKNRANPAEPAPEIVLLEPPAHLRAVAKSVWLLLADEMHAQGTLARTDTFALEAFCQAVQTYRQAQAVLDRAANMDDIGFGLFQKTPNDFLVPSAVLIVRNGALSLMHKLGAELGLSPVSRSRVTSLPPPMPADDPADKWFRDEPRGPRLVADNTRRRR